MAEEAHPQEAHSQETQQNWGLDTNVLLRYLVGDDPAQHAASAHLIEELCTAEHPGSVHPVALCEMVWALRQVYKVPKAQIVEVLRTLLNIRTIGVLEADRVRQAVALYAEAQADFADCFMQVCYLEAGRRFVTFDQRASKLPGTELVPPPR